MFNTRSVLGLDKLSDDQFEVLINYAYQNGKQIENYGDDIILRTTYRRMDLYTYARLDESKEQYRVYNVPIHVSSLDIWKFKIIGVLGTYEFNHNICRVLCEIGERKSVQVVDLITSTVLPSLCPGTEVTAQVIAFPIFIDYYEDLNDYKNRAELKAEWKDGKSIYVDEGSILPLGFMCNHSVAMKKSKKRAADYEDDEVCIHGVVTKVEKVRFDYCKETSCERYQVSIRTNLGNIQIVHSEDQVDKEHRDLIKEGSHVDGIFWIEADPAILDYEHMVFNKERDLKAVQHAMYYGEYDRMRTVISDDVVFSSKNNEDGEDIIGAENVIERFAKIYNNAKDDDNKCYAQLVTVSTEDDSSVEQPALVLAYGDINNFEALLIADLDQNGKISKMTITRDPKYNFSFTDDKDSSDDTVQKTVVDIYMELAKKNYSNKDEGHIVHEIKYLDEERDRDLINDVFSIISMYDSADKTLKRLKRLELPKSCPF